MEDFKGYMHGAELDAALLDENRNWKETLDTLSHELEEAGVMKSELMHTAAFFYAACIEHQGLVLAGPYGESIANAVSAAIWGQYPGILDCSVPYSHSLRAEMEADGNPALIVKNIFHNDWLVPLAEILQTGKKQVFLVHPFAEDLLIEPESFFGYAFPVLTDMLLETVPGNEFVGGAAHGNTPQISNPIKAAPILKELVADGFTQRKISRWLNLVERMDGPAFEDTAWKYVYFPYAYMTGKTEKLEDKMDGRVSGSVREKLQSYLL